MSHQGGDGGGRGGGRGRSRGGGRGGGRGFPGGGVPSQGDRSRQHLPPPPASSASAASSLTAGIGRLAVRDPPPPPVASPAPPPTTPSSSSAAAAGPSAAASPPTGPPLSSKALKPPLRPGYGKAGSKAVVSANHFRVDLLKDLQIYHYDVAITPEVTSAGVNRAVVQQLIQLFGASHLGSRLIAYDGRKNAYTTAPLPFESREFVVKLDEKDGRKPRPGKERGFTIAIKLVAKIDQGLLRQFLAGKLRDAPYEVIHVLDVVFRETPSAKHVTVGRSFYFNDPRHHSTLGGGAECWRGYYQSLRPTQMGLSLNIDLSATAFYEPVMVHEYVRGYLQLRDTAKPLTDADRTRVKKVLRGVKVKTVHQPGSSRVYRLTGISSLPAHQLKFSDVDGNETTVAQYFREKYSFNLRLAWPCLESGSANRPCYLPMEVCQIVPGQRYTKKLNDRQVTAMLDLTCQRPPDRQRDIAETVKANGYGSDDLVNEFGLRINTSPTSVEARVLTPPELKYGNEPVCRPQLGQWNMIKRRMYSGGKVDHWACINFSKKVHPNFAGDFFYDLVGMCRQLGMTFSPDPVDIYNPRGGETIEASLHNLHSMCQRNLGNAAQLQMLFIILPDVPGSYGIIKKVCETELGIVSQCCNPRKLGPKPPNKQYLENVALKINVKVGGSNTVVKEYVGRGIPYVTDIPTIIFGADVTHPSPGEDRSPSIAAVVASVDWPGITRYKGLISAQAHRLEIIADLYNSSKDPTKGVVHGGMIRELLISFYRSTNTKPSRIIFYRDGVSEGQFQQVLLHEMDAIRKACCSLQEDYLPRVTFIVVQKRHHTRLFPTDPRGTDRSGNILPGTVVDTAICHPTEFDFYLCSHAGIKGTSRPAHYHVLYDENRFSADGLQCLTNNLCYTYARCTRAVSVVPPAYYAHLAAFRGRYYMESELSDSASAVSRSGEGQASQVHPPVRALPAIMGNVKEVMFYC